MAEIREIGGRLLAPIRPSTPRNKMVRGVGNGVFKVRNNLPLRVHEFVPKITVVDREIFPHDISAEIEKLQAVRAHFCRDEETFSVVTGTYIDTAISVIGEIEKPAEVVLKDLVDAELAALRKSLEANDKEILDCERSWKDLNSQLTPRSSEDARTSINGKRDELHDSIEGHEILKARIEAMMLDTASLLERMILFIQNPGSVEATDESGIHVANNLSWPEIQYYLSKGARGFILNSNNLGLMSHPVIFARESGVPIVLINNPLNLIAGASFVSIDSRTGEIIINPDQNTVSALEARKKSYAALERVFKSAIDAETTLDGAPLPKFQINIKDKDGIGDKLPEVGLFRTEGMYQSRRPTQAELVRAFKRVLQKSSAANIRLFDIDPDKVPAFFSNVDVEAFSGSGKGIDFMLNTEMGRSILMEQLKALLIAYEMQNHSKEVAELSHNNVRLIIPMVRTAEEVRTVKRLISNIEGELISAGLIGRSVKAEIKIGLMIENEEAVGNLEELALESSYWSIGGNDYTCDVLKILDRKLLMSAERYDWLNPIVLVGFFKIIETAKKLGIPVSFCGEMARAPMGSILLTLSGIDYLSMDPTFTNKIKHILTNLDLKELQDFSFDGLSILEKCLTFEGALKVRAFLFDVLLNRSNATTQLKLGEIIHSPRPTSYFPEESK